MALRTIPILAITALGCLFDPTPTPFAAAFARPSCGPADGPAIVVELSMTPQQEPIGPPFFRLYLAQSRVEAVGRRWPIGESLTDVTASYCATQAACEVASHGSLRFDPIVATDTQDGAVDLSFPKRGRIRGSFHATWRPTTVLCG